MSVAIIKSALSAQFASLATATTPLDPDPAINAQMIYELMATALYNALQKGRVDGSTPAAGEIGELVTATFSTAILAGVSKTVGTITLTPGDWDIHMYAIHPTAAAAGYFVCGISTVNNTRATVAEGQASASTLTGISVASYQPFSHSTSPNKSYYAVAQSPVNVTIAGYLHARRVS